MKIEHTEFGSITIDGKTYPHDVIIGPGGTVAKRKKKLSKQYYGTSHKVSKDEAEFVYAKGSKQLFVGTGQYDNVRLSPEATSFFKEQGCRVIAEPTPRAIDSYNRAKGKKIGLFHVTC